MKVGPDLLLEQQQKLLMTPELRQAISILQMPALELREYVQQLITENPMLEEKDSLPAEEGETAAPAPQAAPAGLDDWTDFLNARESGQVYGESAEHGEDNYPAHLPSLYDHLFVQWQMLSQEPQATEIGNYLIGNLDAAGYLAVSVEEVARQLQVTPEQVGAVLEQIQALHPYGVGARDLTECLLIQLRYYGHDDAISRELVQHHLPDIARGRMNQLARSYAVSVQEIQERCDHIRTLDPKPGLQYSNDATVKYIIPDVVVEKIDGEYVVTLPETGFSGLTLNRMYKDMLRDPAAFSDDARKYLEEKARAALWVIRSIDQRHDTLYRVARCIVDRQRGFLEQGPQWMKPLTLKQVAEMVQLHESTVSRVTANKYMQTPRGVFELKYFFSGGVSAAPDRRDEGMSSHSVKDTIRRLIATEDPSAPLSDQSIVNLLLREGISISRRTVAKYRGEMDIPATAARRRY